ncbi:MAG TPA: hypothetical protein VMU84_04210 [Thermoanaerobaculia bacterium]|nr:hypothetical protein [Thermoanaerobaculia bacterium]
MARGWESKSVESQKDDAARATERTTPLTAEEREQKQKRESLELSRRRIVHELETTQSDARRTSLQHALAHLDAELGKL